MDRIKSVDFLRGFTIVTMILVNTPGDWNNVYAPLLHAEWYGLTPTDLVFPFFLFIVGISISLSYHNKTLDKVTFRKISMRSLKLFLFGVFLNAFLPYQPFLEPFEDIRFLGVLQRIGIVFFISSLLFLYFNTKQLLLTVIVLLACYYLFLGFVHLPNGSLPTFDRSANNWANYIDLKVLGNHMWQKDYDPEGLLSTIPSVATALLGILFGGLFKENIFSKHVSRMMLFAFITLIIGYLWSIWFPISKAIWSSSFVLVTAGYTSLILTIIFYFIDVKQISFGSLFSDIGTNAIVVYFLSSFISKCFYLIKIGNVSIHEYLYQHLFTSWIFIPKLSSLLYAITVVIFYVALGYYLSAKKIIIKI